MFGTTMAPMCTTLQKHVILIKCYNFQNSQNGMHKKDHHVNMDKLMWTYCCDRGVFFIGIIGNYLIGYFDL